MTRKDYIAIGDAMRLARETALDRASYAPPENRSVATFATRHAIDDCMNFIAYALEDDNPRFDRSRWFAHITRD